MQMYYMHYFYNWSNPMYCLSKTTTTTQYSPNSGHKGAATMRKGLSDAVFPGKGETFIISWFYWNISGLHLLYLQFVTV